MFIRSYKALLQAPLDGRVDRPAFHSSVCDRNIPLPGDRGSTRLCHRKQAPRSQPDCGRGRRMADGAELPAPRPAHDGYRQSGSAKRSVRRWVHLQTRPPPARCLLPCALRLNSPLRARKHDRANAPSLKRRQGTNGCSASGFSVDVFGGKAHPTPCTFTRKSSITSKAPARKSLCAGQLRLRRPITTDHHGRNENGPSAGWALRPSYFWMP